MKNAIATTVGFTIGGTACALLVQTYGIELIERIAPGIMASQIWAQSEAWTHQYGVLAVGVFSLIPLALHPLVALAGIQHMPLLVVGLSLFVGRLVKYGFLAWACEYLPTKMPLPKDIENLIHNDDPSDAK
jgi:membrane protein YqaA with SNARE-associated domain